MSSYSDDKKLEKGVVIITTDETQHLSLTQSLLLQNESAISLPIPSCYIEISIREEKYFFGICI